MNHFEHTKISLFDHYKFNKRKKIQIELFDCQKLLVIFFLLNGHLKELKLIEFKFIILNKKNDYLN